MNLYEYRMNLYEYRLNLYDYRLNLYDYRLNLYVSLSSVSVPFCIDLAVGKAVLLSPIFYLVVRERRTRYQRIEEQESSRHLFLSGLIFSQSIFFLSLSLYSFLAQAAKSKTSDEHILRMK